MRRRPDMRDQRWRPEMRRRPDVRDQRWRPEMRGHPEIRWRPDMTESRTTARGGGQSSVLCPDGLPVYREILCPHNTVIQSSRLSIHMYSNTRYIHALPKRKQRPPFPITDTSRSRWWLLATSGLDVAGQWRLATSATQYLPDASSRSGLAGRGLASIHISDASARSEGQK